MKKKYLLIASFLMGTSLGFAQNNLTTNYERFADEEVMPRLTPSHKANYIESNKKQPNFNTKAFPDTLHYEPFTGSLPAGYTIDNANQNNFTWEWNTVYRNGQFSTTAPRIQSTTGATGFMSLPADFYNTPIPGPGAVAMDTWFTSNKITIDASPGVYMRYQHFLRYCCRAAGTDVNNPNVVNLILEVSTDSLNWSDPYDMSRGLPVNSANSAFAIGVTEEEINLTCDLANETEFWYRVSAKKNSHYFWMIDDIAFIEGPANNLTLDNPRAESNWDNYVIAPIYTIFPYDLFSPMPFSATVANEGWATQNSTALYATVDLAGSGQVYNTSSVAYNMVNCTDSFLLTTLPRFVPMSQGDYQVNFLANASQNDQIPGNEIGDWEFSVSDTIFARDDGDYGGGTGPSSYVRNNVSGGTTVGDRFGTMFIVESRVGNGTHSIPTSASFFVSDNTENIGVEIVPKIWEFNEDSATIAAAFGQEVASSFFPYTVTAADTNSLITLPFNTGSALFNGLDSGQYVVGWEVTTLPAGTTFEVWNDGSTSLIQETVSTFVWMGHDPGWGWVAAQPAIRLNMAGLPIGPLVGINDKKVSEVQFQVAPNPSNGQFNLTISSEESVTYTLNVRNMLGQTVYTDLISVNGSERKQLDLSGAERGVYFVTLENENEKLLKKVVLK